MKERYRFWSNLFDTMYHLGVFESYTGTKLALAMASRLIRE